MKLNKNGLTLYVKANNKATALPNELVDLIDKEGFQDLTCHPDRMLDLVEELRYRYGNCMYKKQLSKGIKLIFSWRALPVSLKLAGSPHPVTNFIKYKRLYGHLVEEKRKLV